MKRGTVNRLNSEDFIVCKFDHSAADRNPEVVYKYLKELVGARGFEPPTPWSRTRCSTRLSHAPTRSIRLTSGTARAEDVPGLSAGFRYEV
jgi:hypothetical protein